jgi:hypothetical protein
MRSRGHVWLLIALGSTLLFPSTVVADTIRITSGFLEINTPTSPLNLVGDRRGFRLFGGGFLGGVGINNFVDCPPAGLCGPGAVARLAVVSSATDFGASATLDGKLYEELGSLSGPWQSAELGFASSLTLPSFDSSGVLHSPFVMEGFFSHDSTFETLIGSGIMTSTWRPETIPSAERTWYLTTVRYDFSDAAPVPEPTTLILAGVAGAVTALARRHRRAR